jgi:hypothetical protein
MLVPSGILLQAKSSGAGANSCVVGGESLGAGAKRFSGEAKRIGVGAKRCVVEAIGSGAGIKGAKWPLKGTASIPSGWKLILFYCGSSNIQIYRIFGLVLSSS